MGAAYVANHRSVVCEKFDDETVLINFETGTYFSLRGTAPDVWTLLQSPRTADRIAQWIGATNPDARQTLERMLAQLVAESCVLIQDVEDTDLGDTPDQIRDAGAFTPPIVQAFHDLQELIVVDPVHEADTMDGWPHRPPPFRLEPDGA